MSLRHHTDARLWFLVEDVDEFVDASLGYGQLADEFVTFGA
jgi:hypothetical protein